MKRINIFSGHYGSGKTNVAINYAIDLKKKGCDVCIADLDIVNPYFRTKDSENALIENGIEVISLPFANTNVDLPSLPSQAYGLFQRRDKHVVIDLGGDDRGALALGRFVPYILEENDFEMIFTVNFYRPLTTTPEEAYEVMGEIEYAARMKFTAIVNNSNLGPETTPNDIEKTFPMTERLCEMSGLSCIMTTAEKTVAEKIKAENVFALELQEKMFV